MRVKFWLLALLLMMGRAAHAEPLRVAAAANLQKVLTDALIPAFTKQTGAAVIPTYGATKLLAAQVQNGAPVDVFMAADTKTVLGLAAQHLVAAETVRVYAIGKLVLWSRKDALHHPKRIEDLADPVYAKIAIANPALAPYGLAAQQAFANKNLTARLSARIVQAENITQALQYAQSGNADVALTALSLVIDDKSDPYIIVPDILHTPLAQNAGVVTATKQGVLARTFVSFLLSKQAAIIWKRYGYTVPKSTH